MDKIKVIIIDDCDFFGKDVKTELEAGFPDISVVGLVASGAALFELLETVTPDVVMLDLFVNEDSEDLFGSQIVYRLKTEHPEIKVVIVSDDYSEEVVDDMLMACVEGFICKDDANLNEYAEAIDYIMQGNNYYSLKVRSVVVQMYRSMIKEEQEN